MISDKKRLSNALYYQKNKAKLLEAAKTKTHCDICNKDIIHGHYNYHLTSDVHQLKAELYNLKNPKKEPEVVSSN